MTIDGALFGPTALWAMNLLFALGLFGAVRMAPWGKLRDPEQLHVFLGTVVALLLLWHMGAQVQPGLSFHLLGVTLNGGGGWDGFALNALVGGVVPITLTQVLLILIRWYLPKQFFIYVLVNGFLTAGFVGAVTGYLAAGLLVASGAYSFAELDQTLLPFFPLMFLPEAILNGWLLAVLVAFKPQWVYSFSDEQYLHGK